MTRIQKLELARRREQERLDRRTGLAGRNRSGQYATPGALAVEILRYAWRLWEGRPEPVRFLEPALGTGAFYSALLQVFPPSELTSALGIELDP